MANTTSPAEQQFSDIIGRIFSDQAFAKAMEQNPEKALTDAGYKLDAQQAQALKSGATRMNVAVADASVAAFVRPVVSVLTKGTRPAVSVVVQSAVVASAAQSKEEKP
jgi:hypothetical protein